MELLRWSRSLSRSCFLFTPLFEGTTKLGTTVLRFDELEEEGLLGGVPGDEGVLAWQG